MEIADPADRPDGPADAPATGGDVIVGPDPGDAWRPVTFGIGAAGGPLLVTLGSADPAHADYLGAIAALLGPEWRDAFPRERALYMQQGEIVIEWTVDRGGAIRGPRVVRPSGVPPFDRNVLAGFRRAAARFPAPPATIRLPLRIRAPYRFNNPMFE